MSKMEGSPIEEDQSNTQYIEEVPNKQMRENESVNDAESITNGENQ